MHDYLHLSGFYEAICYAPDGTIKWIDGFNNLVTTVGRTALLDAGLAGNGYIVVGPYMGLVSGTSYTGINTADTMASHTGWLEASNYTAPRKTLLWSPASGGTKTTSTPCFFGITSALTIKGAFVVFGPGSVSTVGDTNGTLYSVGNFSADRDVVNGDALNITYTASL